MVNGDIKKRKRANVKTQTLRMARIAVFVALIAAGAFVKIPIGIVPVSLQCAVCILCALLLGAKDATVSVAIYIAMGLVGIPIFTAGGGFTYVLQPTFGYLLGYLIALPIGGLVARGVKNTSRPKFWRTLLGAFATLAIVYTFGVMYMYLMLNYYLGKAIDISSAWLTGCAVFLPTDCTWCVVATMIAYKTVPLIFKRSEGMYGLKAYICNEEYVKE